MKYTIVQERHGEIVASEVYELYSQPTKGDFMLVDVKYKSISSTSIVTAEVDKVIHTGNDTIIYINLDLGLLARQS